ncbi:hypothetical protein BDZ94DRAFT_1344115, partial [Collybia nuda]
MIIEERKESMIFVVTPLNLLGKQNVKELEKAGLCAITISCQNATPDTFKHIGDGKYNVIIINPEIHMDSHDIEKLW